MNTNSKFYTYNYQIQLWKLSNEDYNYADIFCDDDFDEDIENELWSKPW